MIPTTTMNPARWQLAGTGDRQALAPFDDDLALELRLASLEMQFREHGKPMPHILDPEEHSPAEVEAWLLVELLHRGVDHTKFSKALPYTIPGLMTGDSEDYSPRSCRQGLAQLAAWLQNAADVLDATMRVAGVDHVRIACLPQTLSLVGLSGAGSKRTDFGFSPGTEQNPEPFFYANACAAGGRQKTIDPERVSSARGE